MTAHDELEFSLANHFIIKCRECAAVISQCRCVSPTKTVTLSTCDACLKTQTGG